MNGATHVELCVIGAGTAGFAAAEAACAAGRGVLVITGDEPLGGTCIRRGCMPAKTLLRTSEVEGIVARAERVGVEVSGIHVDVERAVERERALIEEFARDRVADLERFPLRRGAARFTGPDRVRVGDEEIVAERFLIATGSTIVPPPIPGLRESGYLVADDVLTTSTVPRSLVVLGGGPVGCEFAQYFARLGARVTIVEAGHRILRAEDEDVAAVLEAHLRDDGVVVQSSTAVERVARAGDRIVLDLRVGPSAERLETDALFLATGRRPATEHLDLRVAGIDVDVAGGIPVEPSLRTANPRVFVAGDALGWRCLVSSAAAQGAHAARAAFSDTPPRFDRDRWDHHAIATQPQVCIAGISEGAARARGLPVRIARLGFDDVGKALVADEADGFTKIVAEPEGRIAGIAIVGEVAIDVGATAIALIDRGATVRDLAEMPWLHPTMSEALQRVAERWLDAA